MCFMLEIARDVWESLLFLRRFGRGGIVYVKIIMFDLDGCVYIKSLWCIASYIGWMRFMWFSSCVVFTILNP